MIAKTDPGARKEHAAYCSHLRDPEMEGCDCDEPEIRPFAERCGLPGTAPAPPPERTLTREEYEACFDSYYEWRPGATPIAKLLAHDAALRAEVERLKKALTLAMLDRKKERDEVRRLRTTLADADALVRNYASERERLLGNRNEDFVNLTMRCNKAEAEVELLRALPEAELRRKAEAERDRLAANLATAKEALPERTLTGIWIWRDLGYEGPLSHQQVVEALGQIDDYTPQAAAIEITDAALRERLVRAEAAVQDHNLLCERNDKAVRARWFEEKARADKAAADLATATAALREIADFAHCDAEGFIVQPCPCPLCALSLRIAREALARIEEGK